MAGWCDRNDATGRDGNATPPALRLHASEARGAIACRYAGLLSAVEVGGLYYFRLLRRFVASGGSVDAARTTTVLTVSTSASVSARCRSDEIDSELRSQSITECECGLSDSDSSGVGGAEAQRCVGDAELGTKAANGRTRFDKVQSGRAWRGEGVVGFRLDGSIRLGSRSQAESSRSQLSSRSVSILCKISKTRSVDVARYRFRRSAIGGENSAGTSLRCNEDIDVRSWVVFMTIQVFVKLQVAELLEYHYTSCVCCTNNV